MREIKFKAKAKNDTLYYKKGDWIYGHYTYFDDGRRMIYVQELNTWFGIDETTLCQYTGIQDKNGVEIYEGDIIEVEEKEHQYNEVIINTYQANVVFRECCFKLVEDSGLMDMVYNKTSKCKVIGNIHDKEKQK